MVLSQSGCTENGAGCDSFSSIPGARPRDAASSLLQSGRRSWQGPGLSVKVLVVKAMAEACSSHCAVAGLAVRHKLPLLRQLWLRPHLPRASFPLDYIRVRSLLVNIEVFPHQISANFPNSSPPSPANTRMRTHHVHVDVLPRAILASPGGELVPQPDC